MFNALKQMCFLYIYAVYMHTAVEWMYSSNSFRVKQAPTAIAKCKSPHEIDFSHMVHGRIN